MNALKINVNMDMTKEQLFGKYVLAKREGEHRVAAVIAVMGADKALDGTQRGAMERRRWIGIAIRSYSDALRDAKNTDSRLGRSSVRELEKRISLLNRTLRDPLRFSMPCLKESRRE